MTDDYCSGTTGVRVFLASGRRVVKCVKCDATFVEVPYEVGPGHVPLHRAGEGNVEGAR